MTDADESYFFYVGPSYSMDNVLRAMPGYFPAWVRSKPKPCPIWFIKAHRRYARRFNADFEANYWMLTGTLWTTPPELAKPQ